MERSALKVEPSPGVLVKETRLPKAEDCYFKPLNEHAPAYRRPFRIVQDVVVDPSEAGTRALRGVDRLTIHATLDYQACDEKICFTPQSIPLSWTVALKPLDHERARKP